MENLFTKRGMCGMHRIGLHKTVRGDRLRDAENSIELFLLSPCAVAICCITAPVGATRLFALLDNRRVGN
jgi:hypothetical protein